MRKVVYLPVELSVRELSSKSLLAVELVSRGYQVIIGQQWAIFHALPYLPPGAILYKSYHKVYWPSMAYAKKRGFNVLALEEEFISSSDESAIRAFIDDGLAENIDWIFANNRLEQTTLVEAGFKNVVAAGNPRLDLLDPRYSRIYELKAEVIKEKYHDFILINTNLGYINSSLGSRAAAKQAALQSGFLRKDDDVSSQLYQDSVQYEEDCLEIIDQFLSLYHGNVVIRPHPGENINFWITRCSDKKNVKVIRDGDHVPWTIASKALIHCSCTTALEAQRLGKGSINLIKNNNLVVLDSLLASTVGVVAQSGADIIDILSNNQFARNVSNLANDESLAVEVIANFIDTLSLQETPDINWIWGGPKTNVDRNDKKCHIESFDLYETIKFFAKPDEGIEIQKIYKNLYKLSQKNTINTVSLSPDIDDVEKYLARLFLEKQYPKIVDIFSQYKNEAMRTPKCAYYVAASLLFLGDSGARALQYIDQIESVTNALPEYLANLKCKILASNNIEMAKVFSINYHAKSGSLTSYKIYMECAGVGKPFTVFGDSHVRYFRFIQNNNYQYFGNKYYFDCFEYGGATAFGLANLGASTGALLGYENKVKRSLSRTGNLILHFGEIDCRRAAWRYALDNKLPIKDVIEKSLENYQNFIKNISGDFDTLLIYGAKPPIISEDELKKIVEIDPRSVVVSVEDRHKLTNYFNRAMNDFCNLYHYQFVAMQFLDIDFSSSKFQDQAKWDIVGNDVHGNIRFFSDSYYKTLKEILGVKKVH